jgi:hypothetical protein
MYSHFAIPYLDIENYELDFDVVNLIPKEVAYEHKIIAIDKLGEILTIGMVNIEDKKIISTLEQQFKCKVIPFKISLIGCEDAIQIGYNKKENVKWLG